MLIIISITIITVLVITAINYHDNTKPADRISITLLTYWVQDYPQVKAEVRKRLSKGYLTEGDFWACHRVLHRLRQQRWKNENFQALQNLKDKTL